MNPVILLLNTIYSIIATAINKLYDLLGQKVIELKDFATDKAETAKNVAIAEARKAAIILADNAKNGAIQTAATEAALLANAAKNLAISAAALDAATKANNAQSNATTAAGTYTDVEIAKLKLQAEQGYTPRFYEGIVEENPKGEPAIADMPALVDLDMNVKGHYILNVTGMDTNGKVVADKEFKMNVIQVVNGANSIETINVSTNDKLIFSVQEDGGKGSPLIPVFIKKYDDRVMEIVQQLRGEIYDQVSQTELSDALETVKIDILAKINPALLA